MILSLAARTLLLRSSTATKSSSSSSAYVLPVLIGRSTVLLRAAVAAPHTAPFAAAAAAFSAAPVSVSQGHYAAPVGQHQHQHQHQRFQSTAAAASSSSSMSAAGMAAASNLEGRNAYQISETVTGPDACKKLGLDKQLGITKPTTLYHNLSYPELFEHEVRNKEGHVAKAEYGATFTVDTGKYTGRSPKDRWIVLNPGSETAENMDWNDINQATTPQVFDELATKAVQYFNTRQDAYVADVYCGTNPATRKKIRFVHEMAWQQHFVTNMFIRPETKAEIQDFEPDFTIINCCSQVDEDFKRHNLRSETAVLFNVEKKLAVVFGTYYGGENKKGIFSLMNYWLPMMGHFPMHCSANVGKKGDVALFFGLSGTGKTTLSADPARNLIGDDEHGWDDDGVFNFEGGCYAKTINLTEKTEPDIYRAIRTDALLENVKLTDPDKVPDYFDISKTENGRVSYPIFNIPNYHRPQKAGHPKNVIFLSCDAFGVLPPVAMLSSEQAMYHFMSGYTAKVAGTERGIKEPTPNFSTCFGAAFMMLHPTRYAELLHKKLDKHDSTTFLVNSGWTGGPYGIGNRMSIGTTRACIDAILDGSIHDATFKTDPVFGFQVPTSLHGVDSKLLDPRATWSNPKEYDEAEKKLAGMFINNFKKYEGVGSVDYTQYGPKLH